MPADRKRGRDRWGRGSKGWKGSNKRSRPEQGNNTSLGGGRRGQKRRHHNDDSRQQQAGSKRRKQQQQLQQQQQHAGQVPHQSSDWVTQQQQHHRGQEPADSCVDWMTAFPDRPPPQPLVPLAAHKSSGVPATAGSAVPTCSDVAPHELQQRGNAGAHIPLGQRVRVCRRRIDSGAAVRAAPPASSSGASGVKMTGLENAQARSPGGRVRAAGGAMQRSWAVQPKPGSAAVPLTTGARLATGPRQAQLQPASSAAVSPRIVHLQPVPSSAAVQRPRIVQLKKVAHSSTIAAQQQPASSSAPRPRIVYLAGSSARVQK